MSQPAEQTETLRTTRNATMDSQPGSSGAGSATQLSSVLAGASTSARAATMRDDRAFQSLDRHAMYIVAAFVDGASRAA